MDNNLAMLVNADIVCSVSTVATVVMTSMLAATAILVTDRWKVSP